jgi:hypothetical protein
MTCFTAPALEPMNSIVARMSETKSGACLATVPEFSRLLNPGYLLSFNRGSISTCGSAKPLGAATALLILYAALACRTGMATFANAAVSDKPADERGGAERGGVDLYPLPRSGGRSDFASRRIEKIALVPRDGSIGPENTAASLFDGFAQNDIVNI